MAKNKSSNPEGWRLEKTKNMLKLFVSLDLISDWDYAFDSVENVSYFITLSSGDEVEMDSRQTLAFIIGMSVASNRSVSELIIEEFPVED